VDVKHGDDEGAEGLEEEEEAERDAPTSVTHVPEALLRSLRNPKNAAPTVRPPPPAPAAAKEEEELEDRDDSATLVASSKRQLLTKASPPRPTVEKATPDPKPISGTERRIERFHDVTEDSPDEDPSDTGLATEIPEQVMRHLSQRPPAIIAAPVALPKPAATPMFEPPTADMFDPPPPDPVDAPAPIVPKRTIHKELITTLPSARIKKRRGWLYVVLAIVALIVIIACVAFVYWSRLVR
jgi:hypothetical protein